MNNTIGAVLLVITFLASGIFYTPIAFADNLNVVVATYNKKSLTSADVESTAKELFGGKLPDDKQHISELPSKMQEMVVRNIVVNDLLGEEVRKSNIEDTAEFKKLLELNKQQLARSEFVKGIIEKDTNEKVLRQQYAKFTKEFGKPKELHLQHLQVDNEEEATKLYADLKGGKIFDDVIKEISTNTGTNKAQAGDLGYMRKEQLMTPLADAAFKLKDGQFSRPIKFDSGWHILKVLDRRDVKVPSFEEIKPQLEQQVAQELFETYVNGLLKAAKFKLTLPA